MPRPQRIEFEGAFHHVMNRGRSHSDIFLGESYFNEFIKLLKDVSERFDAIIHAYCLMTNHYHLLIETPQANLARIMRHINGVYTQRYNWLNQSDGSLFKGRYKSVLVDSDEYLLQLTRYIHRNPLETNPPMVTQLNNYPWSSYPAYIDEESTPDWLRREKTYQMLGHKESFKGYKHYVNQKNDPDLERYYGKHNILSILGDSNFKEFARETFEEIDLEELRCSLANRPNCDEMLNTFCLVFKIERAFICSHHKGKRKSNPYRAFAMYACQHYGDNSLREICGVFNLKNPGSASFSVNKIKREIEKGRWKKEINLLELALKW